MKEQTKCDLANPSVIPPEALLLPEQRADFLPWSLDNFGCPGRVFPHLLPSSVLQTATNFVA